MRVKRGVPAHKRHHKIKLATKGMTRPHRSSSRRGRQAITQALDNAYTDRRTKKREFRNLWNVRINAGARLNATTYSLLMSGLKKSGIKLDRKILSELAVNEPKAFSEVVKAAKQ